MIESSDESGIWRDPPSRPHHPTAERLEVPLVALRASLRICQAAGGRETGLFWYGRRDDTADVARVHAVVVPRQRQAWGNYSIAAAAMREVHERVEPFELRNLAQVHSHPGAFVEHSRYDDAMANSRRALSIVLPYYGRWNDQWPRGIGVHEFQDNYWYLLSDGTAASRVVLVEDPEVKLIDCRN